MLTKIIEGSIRNTVLVLFVSALAFVGGIYSLTRTPLDAIPDLSDVQVIIYTPYPGQGPQVVEDQVTYPLTTAMLAVPRSKVVRGFSFFGVSFVYVIFEDGTDLYWARSRVLEYLNFAAGKLPTSVKPQLGPDATGVGWVYEYTVEGKGVDLAELRSMQDWYIRYQLTQVPGVSEVASIGGFVKQYQVNVDPNKLAAFGVGLNDLTRAIQMSNTDVGGRSIEMSETEYMVRGLGYLKGTGDIGDVVVKASAKGTPIRVRDLGRVELGPDERRGLFEKNGEGEAVGGIVVMRFGENALNVIDRVKQKIAAISSGLPPGVKIVPAYDRSDLIHRAIATLKEKLFEESVIVIAVCLLFLFHLRSALVVLLMLPLGILIAFIVMHAAGINANIMSLGGIAIAIGAMVDGAIVMIENAHKHLEREGPSADRGRAIRAAACEVGPPLFFSLLIITVSFLPVFTLEAQEGRLFKPLAYTKTFAMASAALLSITLVPVLMALFIRGKITPEAKNPVNRFLIRIYDPVIRWVLRRPWETIVGAVLVLAITVYPLAKLGTEFMPALNEGTFLFMPVSFPGMSVTTASEVLQTQDRIIKAFPEVESVIGKAGRAETATDPAPLEMSETVVNLKPESAWRKGMTLDRLESEMRRAVDMPGVTQAWTMPIKARLDMLTTGIRTPVGIKVFGRDLQTLEKVATQIEGVVQKVPGTASAYAERVTGGYYVDIRIRREDAARYGLTVGDIQMTIASAIGGENITTTVEGVERYPVNVRYARGFRSDLDAIRRVLITSPRGAQIPLAQVADVSIARGPAGIRTENALLSAWIFVDTRESDIGGYVERARKAVMAQVTFPPGTYAEWSGQYEYMQRAYARLKVIVPVTLLIIVLLLYLNFKNFTETAIVLLSLPFSLVGGIWLIYLLGYNMSVAVGVGFIALAGVAAETGVVMLIYLDHAYAARSGGGRTPTQEEVHTSVMEGAVQRVRPKMMTVAAIIAGLLPIMWGTGTGSEVMKKIAAPMVGGMVTSTILTLVVIPAIYYLWKGESRR